MDPVDPAAQRPLKRTRQACEPCRRKKSKCSGERPVCSTCERLRVRCSYALEPRHGSTGDGSLDSMFQDCFMTATPNTWPPQGQAESSLQLQGRLESLESTLAEVVQGLREHRATPSQGSGSVRRKRRRPSPRSSIRSNESRMSVSTTASALSVDGPTSTTSMPGEPPVPWESAEAIARLYLTYCDCQPLPLFCREGFISTFANRDLGVVYTVIALVARFSDKTEMVSLPTRDRRHVYADAAHRSAMAQVASGRVELSTLQTLCLLALNGFHNGETALSQAHRSLCMTLVHSAHLHHEPVYQIDQRLVEERRRCYWSIVLLQQLLGDEVPTARSQLPQARMPTPQFPVSATSPPMRNASEDGRQEVSSQQQDGILYVNLKLSEVWFQAQQYIRNRGASGEGVPPWSPQSAYSKTVESIMNLGQQISSMHRYRFIRMSNVGMQELKESRDYWGPWLLSRLLYHTSICILNHPILIMLQLQDLQPVSELFLQQTTFQRDHHTSWVLHFIRFLESRRFYVSDPLFAYCAAAVATIELYQSFVGDDKATKEAMRPHERRQNYEECLRFIVRLGDTWPSLERIAGCLQRLSQDMAMLYENNMAKSDEKINVDISSFFSILDLSRFCAAAGQFDAPESIFGPTLALCPAPEPPRNANLHRLPRITQMDASDTANAGQDGGAAHVCDSKCVHSGCPSHLIPVVDQGMLLPADQFFDGLFSSSTVLWDSMMGDANMDALDINTAPEF